MIAGGLPRSAVGPVDPQAAGDAADARRSPPTDGDAAPHNDFARALADALPRAPGRTPAPSARAGAANGKRGATPHASGSESASDASDDDDASTTSPTPPSVLGVVPLLAPPTMQASTRTLALALDEAAKAGAAPGEPAPATPVAPDAAEIAAAAAPSLPDGAAAAPPNDARDEALATRDPVATRDLVAARGALASRVAVPTRDAATPANALGAARADGSAGAQSAAAFVLPPVAPTPAPRTPLVRAAALRPPTSAPKPVAALARAFENAPGLTGGRANADATGNASDDATGNAGDDSSRADASTLDARSQTVTAASPTDGSVNRMARVSGLPQPGADGRDDSPDPRATAGVDRALAGVHQRTLRRAATGEIDLPELGRVTVVARARASAVDVEVRAARPEVATELVARTGEIGADVRAAGVSLSALRVEVGAPVPTPREGATPSAGQDAHAGDRGAPRDHAHDPPHRGSDAAATPTTGVVAERGARRARIVL